MDDRFLFLTEEGSVFCVNTVVNGDTFYTALYNPGVVDDNLYHRFTCYVSSKWGSIFFSVLIKEESLVGQDMSANRGLKEKYPLKKKRIIRKERRYVETISFPIII